MFAAAYLLSRPQSLVESVVERTEESSVVDLRTRQLVDRITNSFVMRRGFFTCNTGSTKADLRTLLESTTDFPTGLFTGAFTFPTSFAIAYSSFSTMGALPSASSTSNTVAVTQIEKFAPGDIILLTAFNNSETGSVQQVESVDQGELTLKIRTFPGTAKPGLPGSIPTGFDCSLSHTVTIDTLRDSTGNKVFGASSNVFRLDRVQFAQYETVTNKKDSKKVDLTEKVWPFTTQVLVGDPANVTTHEEIAIPGVKAVKTASATWKGAGNIESDGDFTTTLQVSRVLGGFDQRKLASETSLQQIAFYSNRATNQVNYGAVTIPSPATLNFPTCGVLMTPMNEFLTTDNGTFARFFRVEDQVGGGVASAGTIVTFQPGALVPATKCWLTDDIDATAFPPRVHVATPSSTNTVTLFSGSDTSRYAICDVRSGTVITAKLRYIDPDTNAMAAIDCKVFGTPGVLTYDFDAGGASKCTTDGVIQFGNLVEHSTVPAIRGPTLYTDSTSCLWSSTGATQTDCLAKPGRGTLTRVTVRPSGIPGITTYAHTCTAPAP